MNCLVFRREKLADPRRLSDAARAHLHECSACGAFAREMDETEERLVDALSVRVPEGLADRIVLARRGAWRSYGVPWALAASALLALALLWNAVDTPAERYASQAIEHVLTEPEFLTEVQAGAPAALQKAVEEFGGRMREPIARVRLVKICPAGDGRARHVVLETPAGLATVILVPDKRVPASAMADARGMNALVQPTPRGHYVIVAASRSATVWVDRLIRSGVEWQM